MMDIEIDKFKKRTAKDDQTFKEMVKQPDRQTYEYFEKYAKKTIRN